MTLKEITEILEKIDDLRKKKLRISGLYKKFINSIVYLKN